MAQLVPTGRLVRRVHTREGEVDVRSLEHALRAGVRGEVRFDPASRALYSHDASNYRRVPLGLVVPETRDDVLSLVEICRRHGAPIVARGGGTGLAGQTVNEAVVVDFSKRMRRILAIDPAARRARVEPGVVCDDLVHTVEPFGLTFGPKPATHDHCCFGGMLANNCGGMHAQMNGIAVNNVEAMDVVLYDGTRMSLGWMNEADLDAGIRRGGREGWVLRRLRSLRDRYSDRIRSRFPRFPRRVSGYNLDQLLPGADGRFNLARLLVGSEGTLATMLDATVELLESPPSRAVVALGFEDVYRAADAVPSLLDVRPLALEGLDDILRSEVRKKGGEHARHLDLLPEGRGFLLLELGADSPEEARARAEKVVARMRGEVVGSRTFTDPAQQRAIWDVREAALGSTAFVPDQPDAWPGWEDSAVPVARLGSYARELRRLFDAYGYHPAIYGHFGMGVIHCRIPFDLKNDHGVSAFKSFLSDAADLVVAHEGSLSGEHGDGQARGELLVKMFGPELMAAMGELKAIFDPEGKMNPGKIVDAYPITSHLKLWKENAYEPPDTHFRYAADGGSMVRATLRCVGVGKCRREGATGSHDVMCPSYMVTREEKHSTRGRAHLLWEMLHDEGPIVDRWRDEGVKEALDLCLACKGCKGDCPVNVDVATHKAEFLSHYYEGRLRPRHAYAFGLIDRAARLAELAPGLANLATQTPGLSAVAKLAAGVAQDAKIPPFAPRTFRRMFRERTERRTSERKVVLFADTFNDHFHPDTLMSAVRVLEAAGYEVIVPVERVCCGRPLYDFGMLDTAKGYLERLLAGMSDAIAKELPVVVLEPSCASVLKDELQDLLPAREDAAVLGRRTMLLGEFLVKEAKHYTPPVLPRRRAIVQGHCHHKSVLDWDSERAALDRTGLHYEVLDSGCCGMAGAFGFVRETREVGKACGERVLLPRVRAERKETFVVADGFSCREQIAQHTDRRALHLAEVLSIALDGAPLPDGVPPERSIVRRREAAVLRSMLGAAAAIGFGAALVGAALATRRRRRSFVRRWLDA